MVFATPLLGFDPHFSVPSEGPVHEWALKKSFHDVKISFYTALILTEFTVVSWQYFTGAVTEHVY